ncbi:2Fe-2S iron-sulfur cluster-binding protein [Streptomyces sp. NPDC049879]|uniref:2Fe-2S iron-sulfur cluster-binding protein n=1 Tax=Streptomyces sp. NPDC049879 TaxID=3365598 RepID=UPI003795BFFD
MSNDQQPDPTAHGPQGGWGGEYDADATAFIELPGGYREGTGTEPLAAPGHGYEPPVIDEPTAPPATTPPTMDPGATGQWTMPFAGGGQQDGAPAAPGHGLRPGQAAAAMGQGAALAQNRRPAAELPGHDVPPVPWTPDQAGEPYPPAPVLDPPRHADADPVAVPPAPTASQSDHPEVSYVLRVNGVDRPVAGAWIGESLLYVLRERLGLAGAKDGCAQGECGACSVQVDGRLVAACLVPAATAAGAEIRTVEGLSEGGVPSDVQRALAATAVQCGFCLPGMAMTVHDLLEGNHAPTELETRQALCGNLCRCTGYRGYLDAVRTVVEERAAAHEAAAERQTPLPHQRSAGQP